jgi:hypothetical protein
VFRPLQPARHGPVEIRQPVQVGEDP